MGAHTGRKVTRRRLFKDGLAGLGTVAGLAQLTGCATPGPSPTERTLDYAQRDDIGGFPGIRFEASGFFRLEKADRWWLVTPKGNAFLSFGANHVAPHLVRQEVNSDFWLKEFNAEEVRGPAFMQGFKEKVRRDLAAFHFNTLGTHSNTRYYEPGIAAYVQNTRFVDIPHWMEPKEEDFLDVFSEGFETHCEERARKSVEPHAQNPYLIGYSLTDCPIFTDLDAAPRENNVYGAKRRGLATWPHVLRNLSADHPGKLAYLEAMRSVYREDLQAFNRTYGTDFSSFDALAQATQWRPATDPENRDETRDNHAFLELVVERYYQVATRAIRKFDPNHMILGDKLNGNTDTPDYIVALADEYMDLIFYQTFAYYDEQKEHLDRWAQITSKPFFSGDSSYSVPTEEMPDPYGPHCKDHGEQAHRSVEFAEKAFARPDFVGWNHCGWMDSWKSFPRQALKQHAGLQDPFGNYHQPMLEAFSDFSQRMYKVAG